jgi:hypothetical protein
VGARRIAFVKLLHVLVQQRVQRHLTPKLLQLFEARPLAVNQEVADFSEASALGHFLDRVAAIAQDALLAVDERDRALAGSGITVTRVERNKAGLLAKIADVYCALALRPLYER